MNEKIKELAVRAGFIGENMYPIVGISQESALNNFAELLLQKVILTMEKTMIEQCLTEDERMGCAYAIMDIEEYFDIKRDNDVTIVL